jgi:hypothetical protein
MVSDTVGGPRLHAFRRAATKVQLAARARRSTADPTFRLANTNLHVAARAAMSRPPAFCCNQVKSRRNTQSVLETG